MPDNNGNYTLPPGYLATPGGVIRTSQHNPIFEDVRDALNRRLMTTGDNPMTGDLPMGGNKITGLSDPSAAQDGATKAYVDGEVTGMLNSLGTAATVDHGTAPGEVPLNSDLGSMAVEDAADYTKTADLPQPYYEVITASGTWTKPTGFAPDAMVIVEAWGGGGGGGRGTNNAGGGGGGAYTRQVFRYDDLPSSVAISVAAGGPGRSNNGVGARGGTTTFGSFLAAYGGGGGGSWSSGGSNPNASGGGGGGQLTYGDNGTTSGDGVPSGGAADGGSGGGSGSNTSAASSAVWGGGGGGRNSTNGGHSVMGGGGGGGGLSFAAGDGGVAGGDGDEPSGGGAGVTSGESGSGARGEVRIWIVG